MVTAAPMALSQANGPIRQSSRTAECGAEHRTTDIHVCDPSETQVVVEVAIERAHLTPVEAVGDAGGLL